MKKVNGIKMYDTKELEILLGFSRSTISKLRRQGLLRSVYLGRTLYTSEESLNEYLNGKALQAAARRETDNDVATSLREISERILEGRLTQGLANVKETIEELEKAGIVEVIPDPESGQTRIRPNKEYLAVLLKEDKSKSPTEEEANK